MTDNISDYQAELIRIDGESWRSPLARRRLGTTEVVTGYAPNLVLMFDAEEPPELGDAIPVAAAVWCFDEAPATNGPDLEYWMMRSEYLSERPGRRCRRLAALF